MTKKVIVWEWIPEHTWHGEDSIAVWHERGYLSHFKSGRYYIAGEYIVRTLQEDEELEDDQD